MGHNRLGRLPRTRKWKEVIQSISHDGSVAEIADASLKAVDTGLKKISGDIGFTLTLTVILKFMEIARSKDLETALMEQGFQSPKDGSVFDLIGILRQKIDAELNLRGAKSDVSEVAQNSFIEVLFKYLSYDSAVLFETTPGDTYRSLQKASTGNTFKNMMHEFYVAFTQRYLAYYLSRELSLHVNPESRFRNISEHEDFTYQFNQYINQAIRIADDFTPGWFGKAQYEGNLTHDSISRYVYVAFKKIREEFSRQ